MSCGTPVVGFAQCPGVNHIVRDGVNGLLAPEMTPDNLAATLAQAMENEELRLRLGKGAWETARRYASEQIFDQWEELFNKTAACKGHTRMDTFSEEPFASMARLSAAARREWLFRDFGQPWPMTLPWYASKLRQQRQRLWNTAKRFVAQRSTMRTDY
jgi:hypothetical protein